MNNEKKAPVLTTRDDIINMANTCHQLSVFLNNALENENRYKKKLSETDARIQDLLHDTELSDFTRSEKVHLVNKLKEARTDRRNAKDIIELLDPLRKTVKDVSTLAWKLNEICDKINEVVKIQNNRVYTPRVSTDLKMPANSHVEAENTSKK